MSPKRQGDVPSFLKMGQRLKDTAIALAAEHYAASSFLGNAEILLNEGDVESQWREMYNELEGDPYIPQIDRSYLYNQRDNLKTWLRISATEIIAKAKRQYPDQHFPEQLDEQIVELATSRGRGRPSLDPEEVERRRLEKEANPGRGKGRPALNLTDEQKAERAAMRALNPDAPRMGRPPGAAKTKATAPSRPRLRRVVPPVEDVEAQAARDVGQDSRTLLTLEALKRMVENGTMTEERYQERLSEILGATSLESHMLGVVSRTKETVVPEKSDREFIRKRVEEDSVESQMEDIGTLFPLLALQEEDGLLNP